MPREQLGRVQAGLAHAAAVLSGQAGTTGVTSVQVSQLTTVESEMVFALGATSYTTTPRSVYKLSQYTT